ncbi:DNA mismatch repair endonuclease MutL [Ruminococcus sp. HUN007]|uniref:DNA mismatch repair endonuclease MutL n=1 Tax=Ruminococcus sp. HUN007 TaxID=1514668 RepID=UPI0005D2C774|nr:DNA mismatch repair endonuclease MutL [Ruminococcus sp. HUN007]
MPSINVLSREISELIAAGEVIERPSSVIKELIENSIDAGSKHITVEIKHGGTTFIRIADDGCGIAYEDVPKAFLRHATSKIKDADDLNKILTLGFRGEALASVCAVSRTDIMTKQAADELGTHYTIEGSEEKLYEQTGCPDGTTIIIRDLFYNVPARQKFMKKDAVEGNMVAGIVNKIAMSHPEIAFKFIRDNKLEFSTAGDGKMYSAMFAVYGRTFAGDMIPVDYEQDGIHVTGFTVKPLYSKANRSFQNFFVNDRYVKSSVCASAVEEAYKGTIMTGKFPACVLKMEIAPDTIDVNVHPAKLEIRFSDERPVYDCLFFAIKSALMKAGLVYDFQLKAPSKPSGSSEEYVQQKLPEIPAPEKPAPELPSAEGISASAVKSVSAVRPVSLNDPFPASENAEASGMAAAQNGGTAGPGNHTGRSVALNSSSAAPSFTYVEPSPSEVYENVNSDQSEERPDDTENGQHSQSSGCEANAAEPEFTGAENVPAPEDAAPDAGSYTDPVQEPAAETCKSAVPEPDTSEDDALSDKYQFITGNALKKKENTEPEIKEPERPAVRLVGEVFGGFVISEIEDKMVVIDKHAAHERILYEKLKAENKVNPSQLVLCPTGLLLSLDEVEALKENNGIIENMGFSLDYSNSPYVSVKAMPVILAELNMDEVIPELAENFRNNRRDPRPEAIDDIYHTMACKAAIKMNDKNSDMELKKLVEDVYFDERIRHCPHGRPVMFIISKYDFEKQFRRIV